MALSKNRFLSDTVLGVFAETGGDLKRQRRTNKQGNGIKKKEKKKKIHINKRHINSNIRI
jgi:hypothetical protein